MSDSEKGTSTSTRRGVSWVYELSKAQLIKYLEDNNISYNVNAKFEDLRKQVIEIVKEQEKELGENCSVEQKREILKTPEKQNTEQQTENLNENSSASENSVRSKRRPSCEMDEAKTRLWEFNVNKDDWESYTERMEMYFLANDVETTKQTATLLTKVGAETYQLIKNLCAPTKPSAKEYKDIVKLISDHLCPKPSEAMERCKVHKASQSPTESIANFVARLKSLALYCNFEDVDNRLRDQLICGLSDHNTKTLLFKEDKLTFEKAYKIAIAHEAAEKNAASTDKLSTQQTKEEVNAFISNSKKQNGNPSEKASSSNSNKIDSGQSGWKKNNSNKGQAENKCYCCGRPKHYARECIHRFKTCNNCQRKGHLDVMCRQKKEDKQNIHWQTEAYTDQSNDDDFLLIEGDDNKKYTTAAVNFTSMESAGAQPMYLSVNVSGHKISMQVDTGAYVSVISKGNAENLLSGLNMSPADIKLRAYGNIPLQPIGVFKNIQVNYGNKICKLDLHVMPEAGPTLLGRSWLAAFGLWPLIKSVNLIDSKTDDCTSIEANKRDKMGEKFKMKFPQLFGPGPGRYKGKMLELIIKEGTKPKALKARPVPFALREKVEEKIDRLVKLGHLEKVEISEWATPIVPVIKSDDKVRVCGNFKLTLNLALIRSRHPLPLINDILAALRNTNDFPKSTYPMHICKYRQAKNLGII